MTLILSGMVNICQFVAGIPTFLFLDKIGRRKIAIFGGFAMGVPHIIMAGVVGKYSSSWDTHRGMGWFGVALIYIYVLMYACSYGPLAWCLPAELWSNSKRAKGVGIATATVSGDLIRCFEPKTNLPLGLVGELRYRRCCAADGYFSWLGHLSFLWLLLFRCQHFLILLCA